jgi:hypothetical protein
MCKKAQIPQSGLTTITNMLPGPVSSYSEATTDISAYPPLPSDPLTPAPSTKSAEIATTTAHSLWPSGTAPTPQSSLSSPSHHPDHTIKIDEKGAWIHDNWKYMVIAGTLILVTFCIVLGLAIFYRKRKRSGKKNQYRRAIPLQNFRRARPQSGESTVPLRPRSPTINTFPAHLRWYAEDLREQEQRRKERSEMVGKALAAAAVQPAVGV